MYSRLEDRERTMSKGQNKYRAERMEKQAESGFRKGKNQDKGSRRRDGYKKKSAGATRDMKERQAGKYGRSIDGRPAGYGSGYGYREEDLRRDQEAVFDDGAEKIFGRNPVIAALRGSREVEHIYIARGSEGSAKQIPRGRLSTACCIASGESSLFIRFLSLINPAAIYNDKEKSTAPRIHVGTANNHSDC